MKPYMLITGTVAGIAEFEQKVSSAIESGYELAGDLIVRSDSGADSTILLQPLILEDETYDEGLDFEFLEEEGALATE